MSTKHQIQYRTRPDGEWTYHSRAEERAAQAQVDYYHAHHGDRRIFDYRVVPPEDKRALAARPEAVYVGSCYAFDCRTKEADGLKK